MDDGFMALIGVILLAVGIAVGSLFGAASVSTECQAFGKALIFGKVYTCTKQ